MEGPGQSPMPRHRRRRSLQREKVGWNCVRSLLAVASFTALVSPAAAFTTSLGRGSCRVPAARAAGAGASCLHREGFPHVTSPSLPSPWTVSRRVAPGGRPARPLAAVQSTAAAAVAAAEGAARATVGKASAAATVGRRLGLAFSVAVLPKFQPGILTAITGGVLSGGLHAVSGPDHVAALLPRIMGRGAFASARIGALWGLGHGFSATLIGLVAFFFKERLGAEGRNAAFMAKVGPWTEGFIGISLILIGLLGLKESVLDYHPEEEGEAGGEQVELSLRKSQGGAKRAIFLNGLLHGFSWDGAPSLAPALSLPSWRGCLFFLLSYCGGTMLAMSATTSVIGEGSVRVGKALDQPDIPRKLSMAASVVAIVIGVLWTVKAALL